MRRIVALAFVCCAADPPRLFAQALARRMMAETGGENGAVAERVRHGFRLCLAREPGEQEASRLAALYEKARAAYAASEADARQMATTPLGPAPPGTNLAALPSARAAPQAAASSAATIIRIATRCGWPAPA